MKTPKNRISTDVSPYFSRHIPELNALLKLEPGELYLKTFFDFLAIHTSTLDTTFLETCKSSDGKSRPFGYGTVTFYESVTGERFQIYSEPENSNWNFKIQIVQVRKFNSLSQIVRLLEQVMGEIDESNHEIARVDIAFALSATQITAKVLLAITHMKWKADSALYNSGRRDYKRGVLTGFTSGGGTRVTHSHYEEGAKPDSMRDLRRIRELKCEIQVKKKALVGAGISSVFDLSKIPESFLSKNAYYNPLWIRRKDGTRVVLKKFEAFQLAVLAEGFNNARKQFNTHQNFGRDFRFIMRLRIGNGRTSLEGHMRKEFFKWLADWTMGVARPKRSKRRGWRNIKASHRWPNVIEGP